MPEASAVISPPASRLTPVLAENWSLISVVLGPVYVIIPALLVRLPIV